MSFTSNKSALDFLATHHKLKNEAANKIIDAIKNVESVSASPVFGCKFLKTISYCDLNTWDISNKDYTSGDMKLLCMKIRHMADTGKSDSILPMLEKIATGRIKALRKPHTDGRVEYCGRGHFRWGSSAFILSDSEINTIKNLFNT